MKFFAKTACQLDIMGLEPDGKTPKKKFDPKDLVDRAQPILGQQTNLEPQIPFVDNSKCTGCDTCFPICLQDAITINNFPNKRGHVASINDESCVGCGHCVTVCPSNAIEI